MFKEVINFIKYNNATVLILAVIFIFGTGVFAQTEAGQAVIGEKQTRVEGIDNALLLEVDLDNMDMDFKIEKIEQDEKYYYVTYTYLDLANINNAWQYQLKEKVRKVSKKLKRDLGIYLAEELGEEYDARIKELKREQAKAREEGEEKRVEVVEYSGLIGQTLELAGKIFPVYDPVKKRKIPSPELINMTYRMNYKADVADRTNKTDNLIEVYEEYVNTHLKEIAELNMIDQADSVNKIETDIATTTLEIISTSTPAVIATTTLEIISTSTPAVIATTTLEEITTTSTINTTTEESSATSTENSADSEVTVEIIELPVENVD